MNQYIGGKQASKELGVHPRTLYIWEEKGVLETIRTPGGKRLYNVKKFLDEHVHEKKEEILTDNIDEIKDKLNICYVRVSTNGQKDDLKRQKEQMKELYNDYLIIEDIGSGLNLNKKGLRKIIDLAISGKINKLVIAHKDRLVRFGYELIEDLIKKYSNGEIIILNKKEETEKNPENDLINDVLQIMNVYVAKMNGLRRYKVKNIKDNTKKDNVTII
jgi:predicted site-specific integrase-resolvase